MIHGLPVEIHKRIMPSFWRLPEDTMLMRTQPVPAFTSLRTLDDEGMMLHALMHCASHVFGYGLKTAWDVAWLIEHATSLDTRRIIAWADACAMPAGFYLALRIMKETLEIPIPPELLSHAPTSPRFHVLERVLRQRLFVAMEGTWELNPFTKHALFMLLHDSWRGRLLHVSSMFGKYEREARTDASRKSQGAPRVFIGQLREAAQQFTSYRKLLSQARVRESDERITQLFDFDADPAG